MRKYLEELYKNIYKKYMKKLIYLKMTCEYDNICKIIHYKYKKKSNTILKKK